MIDGAMQDFALTLDKLLDHAAKWHPSAQVVTGREGGRIDRVSYADLRDRSLRVSALLRDLGVERGHRVATLAWNTQAHVEAWYAIMGMGAVCHTLNPRLTAAQLAAMLAQSECRVIVVSADLVPLTRQIVELTPTIEQVLIIDGGPDAWTGERRRPVVDLLEEAMAQARAQITWGGFDERAPCGLCFTSGTTGAPKGVTYTHRSSFLHTLRSLQADVFGITAADSVLTVVPMFHANAWGLPFAVPAAGAKLVLPGRQADGANLARLIAAESVTIAVGVPTVWLGLVEHLDAQGGELPSLKRIIVGGAPLPPALMERIERRLNVSIQTSWGMTELSPSGTVASPNDPQRSAASSGRPAVGVDLLLTDASGAPLPEQRGVEGHLRVRGASVIQRYFGDERSATDDNGWFNTGDLARIDPDGQLFITGRAKDLIKSGGEWINPAEIEAIVGALPEVSLAAVIGRPDPKWGERPLLLVETRPHQAISDETLIGALRGQVPPWWIPDAVIRLERMPLAATGKIDKLRLRSAYGGA
ncbi:long-chain-fatty-acid--CoA ligase [Steroidobacter sp. S1-65]|uniref:Long-chain-fatty-acid--CoA ligase n=1 Tax=Steroidobacter gossypii TaxID=2805490 RepID=A0ABS1WYB7_9GAMM|nr:long-chain-fatty-acid--CoA ligase [Steroidobacter gossypii]MBM0105970.1 long-chain-fatty-acid--CoA ligase [Steroidobacter gossypii]